MDLKKIVVAGSNGFFGSNFIKLLKKEKNYLIIKLDISDGLDLSDDKIIDKLGSFDYFIHFANLSFVPDSFNKPHKFYKTNISTTLNALELCRKYKAKMIYISSYVYGKPQYLPIDENHHVMAFNPYAQSKVICEKLCEGYYRDFDLDIIIFRPFNLYGLNQKNLLIGEIIAKIKNGEKLIQLQNSVPRRDYVNIEDAAKAILLALKSNLKGCYIFNIASNKSYSVKEITELFKKNLKDKSIEFAFNNNIIRKNEVLETRGSFQYINEILGWKPKISFEKGLLKIFQKEKL